MAHAVAAIPLRRFKNSFMVPVALVIGTMIPDLAYFLPKEVVLVNSHSLLGIFLFCVPFGIAAYFFFYLLVSPVGFAMCPAMLQSRLPACWATGSTSFASLPNITISVVLGGLTHLVWDAFTHVNGSVVLVFEFLARPLFTWGGYTFYVYKLLQHGSTAFGLVVLTVFAIKWFKQTPPNIFTRESSNLRRAMLIVRTFLPPALSGFYHSLPMLKNDAGGLESFRLFLGQLVFTGGSVFIFWFLFVGLMWRLLYCTPSHEQ
jgi:hypothetical protein